MTEYGWWIIFFALLYTFVLIIVGNIAKKKAEKGEDFFVGGRNFSWWLVCFCITGLFSGSTYIVVLELSYLTGISAIWYGIAETIQVLLIALLIVGPFRKKMLVTISGLIGDQYGRGAKGIAGAITSFAFPMWSVATAIAFASAIHVFTGIPLSLSVAFTALLLYVYLQSGGMWAIAFTQTMNSFVFLIMLIIGVIAFFINPGIAGLQGLALERPEMFQWGNAGVQVIVAWFGTFLVNVILAQAAFQMALSCRTPREGKKGLIIAEIISIPFILLGVLFGIAAAIVVPDAGRGLIALPMYLMETLPAPLVGLFFLGIWACALSWGAPCQFSGATSLGKDVGSAVFPLSTNEQLVKYTKWSLLVLTGLMIIFGLLRTEQSGWWNILAWTMRNSATFAPVVAALFWPLVTKRAVILSMITGFTSGLLWYHLGGWAPNQFYLDIHPVWIGMSTNVLTIVIVTLLSTIGQWSIGQADNAIKGYAFTLSGLVLTVIATVFFSSLHQLGLIGLVAFAAIISYFVAMIILIKPKDRVSTKEKIA